MVAFDDVLQDATVLIVEKVLKKNAGKGQTLSQIRDNVIPNREPCQ